MERTVPTAESEEIDLYLRTYYSLLRSSTEVRIRAIEEVHAGMKSLLHPGARDAIPDMSALIYSLLRLPPGIMNLKLVVMGQSPDVFVRHGFGDITTWRAVQASARRRRWYEGGDRTLACVIASRSDIDDLIPILAAFQIEWNKLHLLLRGANPKITAQDTQNPERWFSQHIDSLERALETSRDDLERLYAIWGKDFSANLALVAEKPMDLRVQLLSGSLSEYRRATHAWWDHIEEQFPELKSRPVFFVSSNTHSLANILSGFALRHTRPLVKFIERQGNAGLLNEWNDIQAGRAASSRENFLYYVLGKYLSADIGKPLAQQQAEDELQHGILRIPSPRSFDVQAQIIDLSRLVQGDADPRIRPAFDLTRLAKSRAIILNIDYPLGLSAYNILTEVAEHVGSISGAYIMGKAASLNAARGDVMISNVVHDEHSQNTYLFPNCFCAADVLPYLTYGTVLDNQKALTVKGTFLQTTRYMDVFYREGYTVIEMEAGPYLSAASEMYRPNRHPVNEIVNLYGLPFDLGILHYASDTPMNKGHNLGAGSLSYYGMDATYATSLAIIRRILTCI